MKINPPVDLPKLPKWGPVFKNRDHIKDLMKARVCPNDLFLDEINKPDKVLAGIWGIASDATNLRSPYTLNSYKIQMKLQSLIQQAKNAQSELEFKKIEQQIINFNKNLQVNDEKYLSKNQIAERNALQTGQPIPTVTEGDALEDEQLSLSEFKKVFPNLYNLNQRPQLFNFRQFSIQRTLNTTEKIIEQQFPESQ